LEVATSISESLRDLQRSKQILRQLVVVVRDGGGPRPDTVYTLLGARVESVTSPTETVKPGARIRAPEQVTFSFESIEVVAQMSTN
jgi:hypothetical protein